MIIRSARPEANYTVIENQLINDPNLDWREMGVLIYLLSKPDNWQVSIAHLAKQKCAGESSIKSAIKSLKAAGYIESKRSHTGFVDWFVYDSPVTSGDVEVSQEIKPQVDIPHVEKPQEENHRLINTDNKTITEKENNCASVSFDIFWGRYEFKKDRPRAERAWKKLTISEQAKAVELIPAFKRSLPEWHQNPYPATYLNGKRWTDDLTPPPPTVDGKPIVKAGSHKEFPPEKPFERKAPTDEGGQRVSLKDLVKEANKRLA